MKSRTKPVKSQRPTVDKRRDDNRCGDDIISAKDKNDTHTQLAPRARKGVLAKALNNCLRGKKGRKIFNPDKAKPLSDKGKHGSKADCSEITSPVETNTLDQSRIRSLLIKGFTIDEVKRMTKLADRDIKKIAESIKHNDINQGSIDLYTELQRDLSKLVLLETQEGQKRDTTSILNAIKLQADLQEKKIQLNSSMNGGSFSPSKVSNDYITSRDKEILDMEESGMSPEEIKTKTGMSLSSINQALDRATLELPEDLFGTAPSLITETRGLDAEARINILRKAKEQRLNRNKVRAICTQLKNEIR